jgi:hypothetical protein
VRIARRPVLALLLATAVPAGAADQAAPAARAQIAVEPASFDFGKALVNRALKKEFVIRNIGTADLVIDRVTTSCGCAAALVDERLVKPGARASLRVELQTLANPGHLERKVLLRSNDEAHDPLEIKLQVNVVAR